MRRCRLTKRGSDTIEPGSTLAHLQRATLRIPYPWVQGEAHLVRVVTSTGTTFDHQVAVAVETPRPGVRYLAVFALIGLYALASFPSRSACCGSLWWLDWEREASTSCWRSPSGS